MVFVAEWQAACEPWKDMSAVSFLSNVT